jgi:hypothetical protein
MATMDSRRSRECGDLLQFDEVRRRLHLGMPQLEGEATIALADIVGSLGRSKDFDGCFRPRQPELAARMRQIVLQHPEALDEPIEVIRVDRAYFVVDGHKRVSLSIADRREFIDARVSVAPSHFQFAPGVSPDVIARTALEERLREGSGLALAVPAARFAMSEAEGYAELEEAIEAYGFEMSHRLGRLLLKEEAAGLWYETIYRPTIQAAERSRIPVLLGCATEADLFLLVHAQSRQLWGSESQPAQEEADRLVAEVRARADDGSPVRRIVQRARRRRVPQLLPRRYIDDALKVTGPKS